ncbi:MAG TPA: cation:proton antiporter [Gemmatimonadaceae bacterium]
MRDVEFVLALVAVSAGLRVVSLCFAIPYVPALVVAGLGIALIPGLPSARVSPDVVFVVAVPPLLFRGAESLPLRDLRRELVTIMQLAVILVLVSIVAVASVARSLDPAFTWAAALTLGAILAVPDSTTAVSAAHSIKLRRATEAILGGEGLLNYAVTLVLYRVAVAAAVSGTFSASQAGVDFVVKSVAGVALGLWIGWFSLVAHRISGSRPAVVCTMCLLTPYASFMTAEAVNASGVLAVVTTGLYAGRNIPIVVGPRARLWLEATWGVVRFNLVGLTFLLVGLTLARLIGGVDHARFAPLLRASIIIAVCLVVVRVVYVLPAAYVVRDIGRRLRGEKPMPPPARAVAFVALAGVRGIHSLVLALSVPLATSAGQPFPARDQIIFITFAVIFLGLLVQAPTLAPLARGFGLTRAAEDAKEEAHARLVAAEAALRLLGEPSFARGFDAGVLRTLEQQQRQRARRWAGREAELSIEHVAGPAHDVVTPPRDERSDIGHRDEESRRLRSAMLTAEHRALLALRDRDAIGDDVMRRIERDLDLEAILVEGHETNGEARAPDDGFGG